MFQLPRKEGESLFHRILHANTGTGLFSNSRFARVAVSQAVNSFGSSMAPIALAFALLEKGDGLAGLAAVLTATALAPALMMLVGGVAADTGNRVRLIVLSRSLCGAVQTATGLFVLFGFTDSRLMAFLSFVLAAISSYSIPASRAMVRDLVDPEDLQRGTAVMSLCIDTARFIGPGLAGFLLLFMSNGAVLLLDAASFLISALLLLGVVLEPLPRSSSSARQQLVEGIRYSMQRRWIWVTAVCGMFINAAWMAGYQLIGPELAKAEYAGAAFWGVGVSVFTAGLLVGGLVALRARVREPIFASVLASCSLALPLLALGWHAPSWAVVGSLGVAGALLSLAMTWWSSGIPVLVSRDHLARVFAFNSALELGGVPIAYAAVGLASAVSGVGGGALSLVAAAVIAVMSAVNLVSLRSCARVVPDPAG